MIMTGQLTGYVLFCHIDDTCVHWKKCQGCDSLRSHAFEVVVTKHLNYGDSSSIGLTNCWVEYHCGNYQNDKNK